MDNNAAITQLSVRELLGHSDSYVIPMYQRNYAWGEAEITQLILDIMDYAKSGNDYYIGSLIVYLRPEQNQRKVYETIDGQQRFTTLSLLACYLKNETKLDLSWYQAGNFHFESRGNSTQTFNAIFNQQLDKLRTQAEQAENFNPALWNGYELIRRLLPQKLKECEALSLEVFSDYLLNKVQIMRMQVPHDTDLNHYFEIMNNRGEQLEKHEVLKSNLLEILNKITDLTERQQSQQCLHQVWEACANMEKYVQYGFSVEQRDNIFGYNNWSQLQVKNFTELAKAFKEAPSKTSVTLNEIIAGKNSLRSDLNHPDDNSAERFNSIINFPNFLLQVLRVQLKQDIALDDKNLLNAFKEHLMNRSNAIEQVKTFIFNLLKSKFLFDQFILKREFLASQEQWSLKRLKKGNNTLSYVNSFDDETKNQRTLMLLAAFHASTPTLAYKNWLNAALYYLLNAETINADHYLQHLESTAKSFILDRFLAINKSNYFTIIYTNQCKPQGTFNQIPDEQLRYSLSFGNIENNLIFNYLDYLLWCESSNTSDAKIRNYHFTFRSSVEHYYPQHPLAGSKILASADLNSFGNLCLISHEKNSRLSNFMPTAKKEYYQTNSIDSIKQHLMMQAPTWDEESIEQHYQKMLSVLQAGLAP
ncbi:DUF262 domain-containing protein [Thiolinea disciformis]|uniref:DUF262 domain-containing protein n=1 Tax=Thiolinea disciformis TaxID=125614 RepID=UPI00037E6F07|nr:DUF262 domain-containing protein [Thiolinea disciformis]